MKKVKKREGKVKGIRVVNKIKIAFISNTFV